MLQISPTVSGEYSIQVTNITMNKFEGFRISYDRMKKYSDMFALNIYFIFRRWVKRRFKNEIQISHILIKLKLTCPNCCEDAPRPDRLGRRNGYKPQDLLRQHEKEKKKILQS